jgi:multimeric flavodoxin WrbA
MVLSSQVQPENISPPKPEGIVENVSSSLAEAAPTMQTGLIQEQILDSEEGVIHHSFYLPESYDGEKSYPLVTTMPGYDRMWFGEDSSSSNLTWNGFTSWTELDEELIVVSAQLTDWGETSAKQANELAEYFIETFAVDKSRGCAKKKACVIDDKVNEFLDLAADFNGFIFGTPVHWAGATGAITSFLDRVFYTDFCSGRNNFYLKPAAAVMSARRAGTTAAWDQLNKYFGLMQMPIVTSRYWNMVHGATPEQVKEDLEGMQCMRFLARNMVWFLRRKEAGEKSLSHNKRQSPLPTLSADRKEAFPE